jgi:Zn-dependent protease
LTQTQFFILLTPIILFSLTVHEYSHGRVAFMLGDNTAKLMGRLSFNPLRHLDLFGTICIYLLGFGWAKPVPVNWRNFSDPRRHMMYVALAGPISNLVLALIFSFFIRMIYMHYDQYPWLFMFLAFGVYINVALAIFNMLPVFPLDGSSVIKGLVPHDVANRLGQLDRYSGILLLVVFLADHFAQTGILIRILSIPISFVVKFMTQEAFPGMKMLIPFL